MNRSPKAMLILAGGLMAVLGIALWLGADPSDRLEPALLGGELRDSKSSIRSNAKLRPSATSRVEEELPPRALEAVRAWHEEKTRKEFGPLAEFRGFGHSEKLRTLTREGQLTPEIIAEAELTQQEADEVQKLFDAHRAKMKELMAAALSSNQELSIGVAASHVISEFSKEGEAEFRSFIKEIDQTIGTGKRDRLMSGYSVMSSYFNYGYFRTVINILDGNPVMLGNPKDPRVEILEFDPFSTVPRIRATTSLRGINDTYDNLLGDAAH